jgi:hypothetical protein
MYEVKEFVQGKETGHQGKYWNPVKKYIPTNGIP